MIQFEKTVKFKKLVPEAVVPMRAHESDAGYDIVATSKQYDEHGNVVYGTGLAVEIPHGYAAFVYPRSSNRETNLILTNSVGIIDSGYRGEIKAIFHSVNSSLNFMHLLKAWLREYIPGLKSHKQKNVRIVSLGSEYNVGDRIGQLVVMPVPRVEFIEVDELSDSDRGKDGYGSTGK